ncbi:MAG: hypothetical protein ACI8RD_013539 [Bacillariaceae sp.]|jgi:hypothetical protein
MKTKLAIYIYGTMHPTTIIYYKSFASSLEEELSARSILLENCVATKMIGNKLCVVHCVMVGLKIQKYEMLVATFVTVLTNPKLESSNYLLNTQMVEQQYNNPVERKFKKTGTLFC